MSKNQTPSGLPKIRTPKSRVEQGRIVSQPMQFPVGAPLFTLALETETFDTFIPGAVRYEGWLDVAARAAHNFFAVNPLALGVHFQYEYNLTDDECTQVLARMRELGL